MFSVVELQQKLVKVKAATGFERARGQLLAELAAPHVDEVSADAMGNVIARKRGGGKKIMLSAHMDTIGFIVTEIDEKGFLRFDMLGGQFAAFLINATVVFSNGVRGVIAPEKYDVMKDTARLAELQISELYVDLGTAGKEGTEKLVSVGDYFVFDGEPRTTDSGLMVSPYTDDLAGCVALLMAMEQTKQSVNDVYYVFTVQEEIGIKGATTAAYAIHPDIGIAVDVCGSDDNPMAKSRVNIALGKGPAIKIKEARFFSDQNLLEQLYATAKDHEIPYQVMITNFGGTDANSIQLTHGGVRTASLGIPNRYMHTPIETVCVADIEHTAKLLAAFVEQSL